LSITTYASVYPSFSSNEILHIEKKAGKDACDRIYAYDKKVKSLKNDSESIQLIQINKYLNKFKYQSDILLNKKSDHWATPKEFLTMGSGDCEDYATGDPVPIPQWVYILTGVILALIAISYSKKNLKETHEKN